MSLYISSFCFSFKFLSYALSLSFPLSITALYHPSISPLITPFLHPFTHSSLLPPFIVYLALCTHSSPQFDVYSYGLVLYCIYSGKNPFENYRGPITSVVSSGFRPDVLIKVRCAGVCFRCCCVCIVSHNSPYLDIAVIVQSRRIVQ